MILTMNNQTCIDSCIECARTCEECIHACLAEIDVKTTGACVRLDRDCAQLCWLTAAWITRNSQFGPELCRLCAMVCEACAEECEKHKADHCRKCAEACRRCVEECLAMRND